MSQVRLPNMVGSPRCPQLTQIGTDLGLPRKGRGAAHTQHSAHVAPLQIRLVPGVYCKYNPFLAVVRRGKLALRAR